MSDVPDAAIPTGTWVNISGSLANLQSMCGNMSLISAKPDEDLVIAGIANVGLFGSRAAGPWVPMGLQGDASTVGNRPSSIVYDPTNSMRFWESGSYGGCAYETDDDGNTFRQLGTLSHCDVLSIDFTDPNRQTLVVGPHEASQTLYRSQNGGQTWNNIGSALPNGEFCNAPLVLDAQTYLVGCGAGIYRTADGGQTWSQVSQLGGSYSGLLASDGSIYWADPMGGIAHSVDRGVTWSDLPDSPGSGGQIIQLPDTRLASMGSQYVLISAPGGNSPWLPATNVFPPSMDTNRGVVYSAARKAFYIWHNTCGYNVPTDAVLRYDFDYQSR